MAYEQNELNFSLFINKRKEKPNHPDRTGSVKVGGKLYRMAGWIKETKGGDKWLGGTLTLDEERPAGTPAPTKTTPTKDTPGYEDIDDDVPF
jgi:hypothetical protein